MGKSLSEILGGPSMSGVIQTSQTGIPFFLDPAFLRVTDRQVGNKATLLKVGGERLAARVNQYGAPARSINRRPMSEAGLTMFHAFEQQGHDPLVLQNLMGMNGDINQQIAISEIDRCTVNFGSRFDTLRMAAVYSALRYGQIYLDGDGNVLLSSSGAVITVDYGIPAINQNQINGIIAASWATATTDIPGQINNLKKVAIQTTGRQLKNMYYGNAILGYVTQNNFCKDLISRTPMLAESLYNTGQIPNGFMGLNWVPATQAFSLNASETPTAWWGDDTIVACPDVTPQWYRLYEGSFLVPKDVGAVYSDAVAAAQNLNMVYGKFAYGTVGHNPPGVVQYAGDTFFPHIASPSDLYIIDVTP